jgi:hypothetical protein
VVGGVKKVNLVIDFGKGLVLAKPNKRLKKNENIFLLMGITLTFPWIASTD